MVFNKFNASPLDEARRCKRQKVLQLVEGAWSAAREALGLSPGLGDKRKSIKELEMGGGRPTVVGEGGGDSGGEEDSRTGGFTEKKKPPLPTVVGGG